MDVFIKEDMFKVHFGHVTVIILVKDIWHNHVFNCQSYIQNMLRVMDDVRVWLGCVSVHNDRLDLSIELEEEIKCSIASNRCDSFTYILQGWFSVPGSQVMWDYRTGAGAIIWLPQCQWVNHEMSVPVPVKSSWQIWVKSMGAKPQLKSHDSPFPLQSSWLKKLLVYRQFIMPLWCTQHIKTHCNID